MSVATTEGEAVQFICSTPDKCNCTGNNACDCTKPNIAGNCDSCGSPMLLINVDTGEPVGAAT